MSDELSSGSAVRAEIARCLAPMVERLPARYREAIALTDLGGVTMAEASERLHLSVSGTKTRAQRGRALLKKMVLACCQIEVDARGGIVGYERQSGACRGCGQATKERCGD